MNGQGQYKYGKNIVSNVEWGSKNLLLAKETNIKNDFKLSTSMKFREVLFTWLESIRIKIRPQTHFKYFQMIKNHLAYSIGEYEVREIHILDINRFIEDKIKNGRIDRKGGLSISYVKTLVFIIYSGINFAISHDIYNVSDRIFINLPKEKVSHSVLSLEEQLRLEDHMRTNINGSKLGVLLCLHMGLRIGEVCALKWVDVNFGDNTLNIQRTVYRMAISNISEGMAKTKLITGEPKSQTSYRVIPIPTYLFPLILRQKENSMSDYVIAEKENTMLEPRTLQYRFRRYLEICSIPQKKFHTLRHTFATRCVEHGVDVKSLSEILGHSNVNITLNTYVHSSIEQKRKQLELLDFIEFL